jgi:hypothetical protein
MTAYGASPIKQRRRRTRAEIGAVKAEIARLLAADRPMTVRQVFYRLVGAGVVAKTEAEYKQTVGRLLTEMRLAEEIPFGWIADNTRWMRKPASYSSVEQALRRTAEAYRRSLWDQQPVYVELWLEKDALAGVLMEESGPWDVPLMVTRGYPSLSYVYEAAQAIDDCEKPAYLYYFGDYDPSGLDISRTVEARIREFAPWADLTFERVAVTAAQIEEMGLPTRPTKQTDSRSKGFAGQSVEVDAIPPGTLRDLTMACVQRHVDEHALAQIVAVEAAEREALQRLVLTGRLTK